MLQIQRDTMHTQAFGCWALVQIGSTAFLLGETRSAPRLRVELFRPVAPRFRVAWRSRPDRARGVTTGAGPYRETPPTAPPVPRAPSPKPLKPDDRVFMDGHPRLKGTVTWTDGSYAWASLDQGGQVRLGVDRFHRRKKADA